MILKPTDMVEQTLATQRIFEGRALTIDIIDMQMPTGRKSTREVVRHNGAVVVLGELPDGRFLLEFQYRKAVEDTLIEAIAGCIELGESPEVAAVRETQEETGYAVNTMVSLGISLPCPGYCEEKHHLFYAKLAKMPGDTHFDMDENIKPLILTAEEIDAAIADGSIIDGKTIVIWHRFLAYKKAQS